MGDEVSAGDEGFFVGKRDVDPELRGAEGALETCDADDGANDEIGLGLLDEFGRGVFALDEGAVGLELCVGADQGEGCVGVRVGLLLEQCGVGACAESDGCFRGVC